MISSGDENDSKKNDTESQVFYDFNKNVLMMVLGGFIILNEPKSAFIINICLMLCVFLLFIYLFVMEIITVYILLKEDPTSLPIIQFYIIFLLFVAILLPSVRICSNESLMAALEIFKEGVYTYIGEEKDEAYQRIKRTRVGQLVFVRALLKKVCIQAGIGNVFGTPLIQLIFVKEDKLRELQINRYLPTPMYMNFDTFTVFGYVVAFLAEGMLFFFLYISTLCLVETYLSCTLQLVGELEVLNESLRNIQNRAYLMALKELEKIMVEGNKGSIIYQECLYSCLRQNILHHHAILRLKKAVSPYIETLNAFGIICFSVLMASSILVILENPKVNVVFLSLSLLQILGYLQWCWVGQLITDKSSEIRNVLYAGPWLDGNKKFITLLKLMLVNVQKPIIMSATGFRSHKLSLETFADLSSVGYKMMNILR